MIRMHPLGVAIAVMSVASAAMIATGGPTPLTLYEHVARHGGQFGDADDLYHYEALLAGPQELVLYVGDEHNHPVDTRQLQSRWTINPDDASPMTGVFTAAGDGAYLTAAIPPMTGDQVHVEVAVLKGAQWVPMEFSVPVRTATAQRASASSAAVR